MGVRWRDVKQNKIKKIEKEIDNKNYKYATLVEKSKAFITDSFLLAMPIFYFVIYVIFGNREGFSHNMALGWLYILAPLGIVVSIFCVVSGQTPGLKAYDLKVIDKRTGEKPTFLLSFLRFITFNIVLFSFIGLFFPLFRKDKQGLHDILTKTAIIKIEE